jgi:hypothetical protein
LAAAAQELGRSPASVRNAAARFRISLRRPGCRRGAVIGQPRGVSLARGMREDLVSGAVDPVALEKRMRLDVDAPLCPLCGCRTQRPRDPMGWCLPCHLEKLSDGYRQSLAEIEAQRALSNAKQRLSMARRGAITKAEPRIARV